MRKTAIVILLILFYTKHDARSQTFEKSHGQRHLIGPFQITDLESDTVYSKWFTQGYADYSVPYVNKEVKRGLKDVEVDIYMGTWCGDSKYWVPRFIKLWDQLGLKREQLNLIGLYSGSIDGTYKQGPNGEERGKMIHRVPTFIFKKKGKEYARIVEYPLNDLHTDIAQISLGFPSKANYRIANQLLTLMDSLSVDDIRLNMKQYLYQFYALAGKSGELNTLGYVLLDKNELEKAILVFEFNTYLFKHVPNVYDSYAEALALNGDIEKARLNYSKVLAMEPENKNAQIQLEKLKEK